MIILIRKILVLYLVLCLVLLSACEKTDKTIKSNKSEGTLETPAKMNGNRKKKTIRVSGVIEREDGLYFANSLEDFIVCYNANYYNDNGINYILPYSEWYSYVQDFGRHKGKLCYEFTADKKILTLPTIAVYTPQNETIMKELTVNFDDHSYTDKMYRQYEEMCFYMLKVFFPDMGKEEITKLYKKLNKKAYGNIYQNEQGFHSENPPSDLYNRNSYNKNIGKAALYFLAMSFFLIERYV